MGHHRERAAVQHTQVSSRAPAVRGRAACADTALPLARPPTTCNAACRAAARRPAPTCTSHLPPPPLPSGLQRWIICRRTAAPLTTMTCCAAAAPARTRATATRVRGQAASCAAAHARLALAPHAQPPDSPAAPLLPPPAGGPLLIRNPTTRAAAVLGVTSHGPDCLAGPNYQHGYYTDVRLYLDAIETWRQGKVYVWSPSSNTSASGTTPHARHARGAARRLPALPRGVAACARLGGSVGQRLDGRQHGRQHARQQRHHHQRGVELAGRLLPGVWPVLSQALALAAHMTLLLSAGATRARQTPAAARAVDRTLIFHHTRSQE